MVRMVGTQPLQLRLSASILRSGRPAATRHERARPCRAFQLFDPVLHDVHEVLAHLPNHLSLAYESVTLPCQNMNCGDIIYRSTLDPVLRMEQKGLINPRGVALVSALLAYLTVAPGVLAGAIDFYIASTVDRLWFNSVIDKDDVQLGKRIAAGGFGTVYQAQLLDPQTSESRPIILKKAREFGEAEVWMNERLMRAAPQSFAAFLTAFEEKTASQPNMLWLLWEYEGDATLADYMQKREFPYNLEERLFGKSLDLPKGPRRKMVTLRAITQQILQALQACHSSGIVHRDIKPENCIVTADRGIKLIDLGAAADLRVGINYVPNEFLLDPRYAPPQQYIMSRQTPRAPPLPLAAVLSPVLWNLNVPDRFDMYSVGILLLQMLFAPLRNDKNLVSLNRKLEQINWNLPAWRDVQKVRGNRDWQEGFEMLELDDDAAWELMQSLLQYDPRKRLSASRALRHRWFGAGSVSEALRVLADADKLAEALPETEWIVDTLSRAGTQKVGGLTEAELSDELAWELPGPLRQASSTIAWWRERQADLNSKIAKQKVRSGARLRK